MAPTDNLFTFESGSAPEAPSVDDSLFTFQQPDYAPPAPSPAPISEEPADDPGFFQSSVVDQLVASYHQYRATSLRDRARDATRFMGTDIMTPTGEERTMGLPDVQKLLDAATEAEQKGQAIPMSQETKDFLDENSDVPAMEAFKKAPIKIIVEIGARSGMSMVPGLVMGATAGSVGGPAGFGLGMGTGSGLVDFANTVAEELREKGVDLTDAEAFTAAVNDDELMAPIEAKAAKRAAMVGGMDALAGLFGAKMLTPGIKNAFARELANAGIQMPLQAAAGAAGEAGGQLVSGDDLNTREIAAEAAGELVTAPIDIAAAAVSGARDGDADAESDLERRERELAELEERQRTENRVTAAEETRSLEALQTEARERAAAAGGDALDQELAAAQVAYDLGDQLAEAAESRRAFFARERDLAQARVDEAKKAEEQLKKAEDEQKAYDQREKERAKEQQAAERQKREDEAQARVDMEVARAEAQNQSEPALQEEIEARAPRGAARGPALAQALTAAGVQSGGSPESNLSNPTGEQSAAAPESDQTPVQESFTFNNIEQAPDVDTDQAVSSAVLAAANQAASSPTNTLTEPRPGSPESAYPVGEVNVQGFDLEMENAPGTERRGRLMTQPYGRFKAVKGADGDMLDVFVGPQPNSDKVYVIDQVDQTGKFDEHKVMLGYPNQLAAVRAYKSNYDEGWTVGPVTEMSVDEFRTLTAGGAVTRPVSPSLRGPRGKAGLKAKRAMQGVQMRLTQRAPDRQGQPMTQAEAQERVDALIPEGHALKKIVHVVGRARDLPGEMLARIPGAQKRAIFDRRVPGFVDSSTGQIYIVADANKSTEVLLETVLHEGIGHMGVSLFNIGEKKLLPSVVHQEVFDSVSMTDNALMDQIIGTYGLDVSRPADQRVAGDEYIAHLAENPEADPGVWRRVVDKVREVLRDMGLVKNWTDNDIRQMLRRSADYLARERRTEHSKLVGLNRGLFGPEVLFLKQRDLFEPYVPTPEQTDIPVTLISETEQSIIDVFERARKAGTEVTSRRLRAAKGAPVNSHGSPTSYPELTRMLNWAREHKPEAQHWYSQFRNGFERLVGAANMREASFLFGLTSPQAPVDANVQNTLIIMMLARQHNPVTNPGRFRRRFKEYRDSLPPGEPGFGLTNSRLEAIIEFYKTGEYRAKSMKAVSFANEVFTKYQNKFHPYAVMDRHIGRVFGFKSDAFTDRQYRYMQYLTQKLGLDNNLKSEEVQALLWYYAKEHFSNYKGEGTWEEALSRSKFTVDSIKKMQKEGNFSRFRPFSEEVGKGPPAKFEIMGSTNKPRAVDAYSNFRHQMLIDDAARARAPAILIALEPGHRRGYGFPSDLAYEQRERYRDETLHRITDADGQIPLLKQLDIPHEIFATVGSWEGALEPSMEIKLPGATLEDADLVAAVLGDAFLQDAAITAQASYNGQEFIGLVGKTDGTEFTHDEITNAMETLGLEFSAVNNSTDLKFIDSKAFEGDYTVEQFQEFVDKLTTYFSGDQYAITYAGQEGNYFDTTSRASNLEDIRSRARAKGAPDIQRTGIDPLYAAVWEAYRGFAKQLGHTPKNTTPPVEGLPAFDAPPAAAAPETPVQMRLRPGRSRGARAPWQRPTKTLKEHFRASWNKWMSAAGNLPDRVFRRKIERDSEMRVEEMHIRHLVADLDRATKRAYEKSHYRLTDDTKRRMNDYLAGRQTVLSGDVKQALDKMRQYLDTLSQRMVDLGVVSNPETAETVLGNLGKYLNRSYQAFDNARWPREVPDDVRQAAYEYLEQRFRADGVLDDLTPSQVESRVNGAINNILESGTAADKRSALITEWMLGQKDLSMLIQRKDIAEPIRRLLGEYEDPRVNFTRSAIKMERAIMNHVFLHQVADEGKGVFLFDKPEGEFAVELVSGDPKSFGPLQGLYTTPDVRDAFVHILDKPVMDRFWRTLIGWNGFVKYGKTVLSATTIARNFLSASFFSIANGHYWMFEPRIVGKAAMNVQRDLRSRSASRAYLKKMVRLGVIYDNPHAGELIGVLKDFTNDEGAFAKNMVEGRARAFFDFMTRMYQAGDDFWKIIGFEIESARLAKDMPRAQAEAEAAARIRNTYPTYSMVGRAIKWLRRFPLVGSFVSFPAEIVRTSTNIVRYTAQDIAAGRKQAAWQRVTGMVIAAGAGAALREFTMNLMGLDDEDDEAIRMMGPPWSRNSDLAYAGYNEHGLPEYFDLSYLDPYNYLKRPLYALLRGDRDWGEKFKSALKDMTDPFIGRDIAFGAIVEVANNKKETGGPVYNPEDSPWRQRLAIADHLRQAIQPGTIGNFERIWRAANDEVTRYGKKFELEDEMYALVGFRRTTMNPLQSIAFKTYELRQRVQDATGILTRTIGDQGEVSDAAIESAFNRMVAARRDAHKEMSDYIEMARGMGLGERSLYRIVTSSGVSKDDARAMIAGDAPVWKPSGQFMRDAMDLAVETNVDPARKERLKEDMRARLLLVRRLARDAAKAGE